MAATLQMLLRLKAQEDRAHSCGRSRADPQTHCHTKPICSTKCGWAQLKHCQICQIMVITNNSLSSSQSVEAKLSCFYCQLFSYSLFLLLVSLTFAVCFVSHEFYRYEAVTVNDAFFNRGNLF